MIKEIKNLDMRKSGIIYDSALEQIRQLYNMGQTEAAGELAISAIEMILCGEISSDNPMIEIFLTPLKGQVEKDKTKQEQKIELAKNEKLVKQRLEEVAEMHLAGMTQTEIGSRLGVSQQTIGKRLILIRAEFPYLLGEDESEKSVQPEKVVQDCTTKNKVVQPKNSCNTTKNDCKSSTTTNEVVQPKNGCKSSTVNKITEVLEESTRGDAKAPFFDF